MDSNISIKEKQEKISENVINSTCTSSTKEEEDFTHFSVLLVMDKYTLHASNILKLNFISSVPDYLVPRSTLEWFFLHLAPYE
jgi:hypothetical protein